jgi:hypothetical protein
MSKITVVSCEEREIMSEEAQQTICVNMPRKRLDDNASRLFIH